MTPLEMNASQHGKRNVARHLTLPATSKESTPDAVYNVRPLQLTGLPTEIYYSIFATFPMKSAQRTKFYCAKLWLMHTVIARSLAFYTDKDERGLPLDFSPQQLVHEKVFIARSFQDDIVGQFTPKCESLCATCDNFCIGKWLPCFSTNPTPYTGPTLSPTFSANIIIFISWSKFVFCLSEFLKDLFFLFKREPYRMNKAALHSLSASPDHT